MAAVFLPNTMAQNNTSNATDDVKPTILHDFLGPGCAPAAKFTAASDLAERQAGTLYEGVPFFRQQNDVPGSKIQYSGSKRSQSDSSFIPQLRPDLPETSHLMKMMRNTGAERPRWAHEDDPFMGVHQVRPTPSSKWERAIPVNVGPVLQYPPHSGPYGYQPVSSRFKDSNTGSPLISHLAADEGSRTGIKGSGILSSANVGGSAAEPSSSKLKSLISNNEPNSSSPVPQGSTSLSRQMTIFYGGQAHVFDDVHPNKADVIMALAGSNGGSWSTSLLPNSSIKPTGRETIHSIGGPRNISMKDRKSEEQQ